MVMGPATWYLRGRLVSRCSEGTSGIGTQERDLGSVCMDRGSLQPWEWKRLPRDRQTGGDSPGQSERYKTWDSTGGKEGLSRVENSPWWLGCGASSVQRLQIDDFRNLPVKPPSPSL